MQKVAKRLPNPTLAIQSDCSLAVGEPNVILSRYLGETITRGDAGQVRSLYHVSLRRDPRLRAARSEQSLAKIRRKVVEASECNRINNNPAHGLQPGWFHRQ